MCVAPVWGLMVGVDDDGRQRWKLSVGLFACLCGVVAMLRLCCVVCGCGCDGVWCDGIVCVWLVVWSVFPVTASELRAQRAMGLCMYLACGVVSLRGTSIRAEGAAAIGAGLVHVPSLTTLQYVRTRMWFLG